MFQTRVRFKSKTIFPTYRLTSVRILAYPSKYKTNKIFISKLDEIARSGYLHKSPHEVEESKNPWVATIYGVRVVQTHEQLKKALFYHVWILLETQEFDSKWENTKKGDIKLTEKHLER